MSTLMVGYDLNKPGQNYDGLTKALQAFDDWWHYLDSTWLVVTNKTPSRVRDELGRHLDSGDELLVIEVSGDDWAARGFDQKGRDWLLKNL